MVGTDLSPPGGTVREDGRALHDDALVWDMTLPFQPRYADFALLDRYRASGFDFVSLTVNDFVNPLAGTLLHLASVRQGIRDRGDEMALVESVADIQAAKEEGKLALGFHFQETNPLEGSLAMIELYYQLGVRHMLLAYNQKNRVGDGCAEPTAAALSRFGVSVVKEMNRVGMMVDGSHSGYRTTLHAMEVSSAPFVFSHANAHALHPHYRNIRDDQIKACAETNGVIGINGCGCFLGDAEASTEAIFRHVDYMVNLVGPKHVGIALDYTLPDPDWTWDKVDPDAWPPSEASIDARDAGPEQLPELTRLMLDHGYGEEDVRDILGRNFLRVAREVWR